MQWICGWGFAVMDRSNANLCGNIPGTPEFLRNLRQETERVGAILIFDEVNVSCCGPGKIAECCSRRSRPSSMRPAGHGRSPSPCEQRQVTVDCCRCIRCWSQKAPGSICCAIAPSRFWHDPEDHEGTRDPADPKQASTTDWSLPIRYAATLPWFV
jgi:hypothetical protein